MIRSTRTDDITKVLREEVLRGQYRPGERLPSERELAGRFATTRGVARVALKKLEQLGLAEVLPGGARVQPLAESSLEAVGHLLELENPPDPELVDQVLEVVGALLAANVRMTLERAEPEQLARIERLIERLRKSDQSEADPHQLMHEFGHTFMDATDNVVMKVLRRGLRTDVISRLNKMVETIGVEPPEALFGGHVDKIAAAVESRDGLGGYEAMHQLWLQVRRQVRTALEAAGQPPAARAVGATR